MRRACHNTKERETGQIRTRWFSLRTQPLGEFAEPGGVGGAVWLSQWVKGGRLLGVRDGLQGEGRPAQHLVPLSKSHRASAQLTSPDPNYICVCTRTHFFVVVVFTHIGFSRNATIVHISVTSWVIHHLGKLWHPQWWGRPSYLNYPDPYTWKSQHSIPRVESSIWPFHCLYIS